MRVVLDTNVLISALLSPHGAPARVIHQWEEDRFEVVTSPALLAELARALRYERVARYFQNAHERMDALVGHLGAIAVMVDPQVTVDAVPDDPADDRVIECALAGSAAYVVIGDRHLLALQAYEGVIMLSPAQFLVVLDLEGDR